MASPPWIRLGELEHASLQLERGDAESHRDYTKWLKLLIAPGASLGGARPKASVIDDQGRLWIAKFPSVSDDINIGAWEYVTYLLAQQASLDTSPSLIKRFNGSHDTFLTQRFDRAGLERIHFSSAMTLLNRSDGDGSDSGASYLDIVEMLTQQGAQLAIDLEQLWRRIVFNICVSNVDDHLRNHGFLLTKKGWRLSPVYDLNPVACGNGLRLNISKDDNSQSLDLALQVATYFRLNKSRSKEVLRDVVDAVRKWPKLAADHVSRKEISAMKPAFRVVDK